MTKIILASHGELSKGMLDSVKMIVGDLAKNVETFSLYPGANPGDYADKLKKEISSSNEKYIIICDIKGGSVYNALVQTCTYDNVDIFSGMNMNLVLEIVLAVSSGNIDLNAILSHAKDGITLKNRELARKKIEEEDF
ncbi:PTS sugar transporter subunit IIA [Coprobacillus sp. AF33-1AC]|uniref:PTS sugar transporter subunit IIA n=1 Tax=Coprobacillus sp. AF33-1AC TaxID=2292032 RepID=UPI000E54668E|nr:PTS sugar transporter subunit IIA [Coprobacillus sp. AF33-1AC]RHM63203.1 PTS mannose transporter subunit IIAB [Coprobacillus sp. AF33-1AC]